MTQMAQVELPDFESIQVNEISSEANAIHVMILSGILNDFLGTDESLHECIYLELIIRR